MACDRYRSCNTFSKSERRSCIQINIFGLPRWRRPCFLRWKPPAFPGSIPRSRSRSSSWHNNCRQFPKQAAQYWKIECLIEWNLCLVLGTEWSIFHHRRRRDKIGCRISRAPREAENVLFYVRDKPARPRGGNLLRGYNPITDQRPNNRDAE